MLNQTGLIMSGTIFSYLEAEIAETLDPVGRQELMKLTKGVWKRRENFN